MRLALPLTIFLLVHGAFSLQVSAVMTDHLFNAGDNVQVSMTLQSDEENNFTINYYLFKDESRKLFESEKKRFNGTMTYKKTFSSSDLEPGYYALVIESFEADNLTLQFRLVQDCLQITGSTNAYSLPNQSQDYAFTILNTCDFEVHNVSIQFLNVNEELGNLAGINNLRISNVTSPKSSRNERLKLVYYEGESQILVDFRIRTQEEIDGLIQGLINSTQTIINNTQASMSLAFLGDTSEIRNDYYDGLSYVEKGLQELEKNNYALSIKHFSESVKFLRRAGDKAESIIQAQAILIIMISVIVVGVFIIMIYNKYRNAVKNREIQGLGKS